MTCPCYYNVFVLCKIQQVKYVILLFHDASCCIQLNLFLVKDLKKIMYCMNFTFLNRESTKSLILNHTFSFFVAPNVYLCEAIQAHLMNKRQYVSVSYYVNIRFIANVQLYPNTIVSNCFQDTLQQQYRYLYKTHINFSTSYKQDFSL